MASIGSNQSDEQVIYLAVLPNPDNPARSNDMTYPAVNIDSIIESAANPDDQPGGDIVEFDFRHRDSLSENFNEEIDAWARHCLASNGFGDYL